MMVEFENVIFTFHWLSSEVISLFTMCAVNDLTKQSCKEGPCFVAFKACFKISVQ